MGILTTGESYGRHSLLWLNQEADQPRHVANGHLHPVAGQRQIGLTAAIINRC